MNTTLIQRLLLGLVIVLPVAIILIWSGLYTVSERETVVVLQFGDPVRKRVEPGLYSKVPFIQEVRRLPKTLQFWRTREAVVDLLTADGEKIEVTAWAIWRITDPQTFIRVLRTVENAELAQIKVKVRAAIRDVITSHTLTDVIRNSDRELSYSFQSELPVADKESNGVDVEAIDPPQQLMKNRDVVAEKPIGREAILAMVKQKVEQGLRETADGELTERGIDLVDLGIGNISFVPTVREASFEKQKAFMESIAAKHLNLGERLKQEILNKTNREVEEILGKGEETSTITRGEVDAEIIQRYAETMERTGDFYKFIRTLELYESSLTGNTRLILTTNSELFRLLKTFEPNVGTSTRNPAISQ